MGIYRLSTTGWEPPQVGESSRPICSVTVAGRTVLQDCPLLPVAPALFPSTSCCGSHVGLCEGLWRRCCRCAPEGALAAALSTHARIAATLPPQPDSFTTPGARTLGCAVLLLLSMSAGGRWCTPEGTPALRLSFAPCRLLPLHHAGRYVPSHAACVPCCLLPALLCWLLSCDVCLHAMCSHTLHVRPPALDASAAAALLQRVAVVCLVGLICLINVPHRSRLYRFSSSVETAHHVFGFCDGQFVHPRRDDR